MVEIISIVANLGEPEFIRYLVEYDEYDIEQKYGDEEIIDHTVNNYSKSPRFDEYISTMVECGFNYKNYYDKNKNTLLMMFATEKKYHIVDCIIKTIGKNYSYLYVENSYNKNIFDILFKDKREYFDRIINNMMEAKDYGYLIDLSIKFSLFDTMLEIVKTGYHKKYYFNDDRTTDTLLTFVLRNTWIPTRREISLEIIKHCSKDYINNEIDTGLKRCSKLMTPVMIATMYGDYDVFIALLNAGANIDFNINNNTIFDFLACNRQNNVEKMLDMIVAKLKETIDINQCEKRIELYFKRICVIPNNKSTINHIIINYPNIFNNIKKTIFHYLAIKGHVDNDTLNILLENNVLINATNEEGQTPIMIAIKYIHTTQGKVPDNSAYILDLLLERNILLCNVDNKGNNVLSYFDCINKEHINKEYTNKEYINKSKCIKCDKYYSLIKEKMNNERQIWCILQQPIYEEITYNMKNYTLL